MSPSEIRRELARLGEEAEQSRASLAELVEQADRARDLVAAIRSILKVEERTPPAEAAQEEARAG